MTKPGTLLKWKRESCALLDLRFLFCLFLFSFLATPDPAGGSDAHPGCRARFTPLDPPVLRVMRISTSSVTKADVRKRYSGAKGVPRHTGCRDRKFVQGGAISAVLRAVLGNFYYSSEGVGELLFYLEI